MLVFSKINLSLQIPEDPKINPKKGKTTYFGFIKNTITFYCDYPKLSYIIDSGSTPRLSSIFTTALLIGPGPHM